jgi:hypothetical protein
VVLLPWFCCRGSAAGRDGHAEPPMIEYAEHPLLWPAAFVARFDAPLRHIKTPPHIRAALVQGVLTDGVLQADAPFDARLQGGALEGEAPARGTSGASPMFRIGELGADTREALRRDTRSLLRHGGYKPSGRGKPSAEYLARACEESDLPSINIAVDSCNALSLHSALPISVVDLDLLRPPFRVAKVDRGSYVFNASGQEIQLDGLLCLMDADGPRANGVKDCHETKTHGETRAVLSIIWGSNEHADHCERVLEANMGLLRGVGAEVQRVGPQRPRAAPVA